MMYTQRSPEVPLNPEIGNLEPGKRNVQTELQTIRRKTLLTVRCTADNPRKGMKKKEKKKILLERKRRRHKRISMDRNRALSRSGCPGV